MTPEQTDYAEKIKRKVADELECFLLSKDTKPESVQLIVKYRESIAKIEIDLNE